MFYKFKLQHLCLLAICMVSFVGCAGKYKPSENMANLEVQFADSLWDGVNVPENQQCNKFGDKAETPSLKISNIPPKTTALIVEYSDRDAQHMDNGGHGKVGYKIATKTTEATIPAIEGHTFDLPEDFFHCLPSRKPELG